jgi:hypothetical protein
VSRQQIRGRNLAVGIDAREVAREPAHNPESLTPPVRARVDRQPGPRQRQFCRDPLGAGVLEEADEVLKQPLVCLELKPEPAADRQVVLKRLVERIMSRPPAMAARAP